MVVLALPMLGECDTLNNARRIGDIAATHAEKANVEMLVEADIERHRLRKARCYSPLLTLTAIGAAAEDPRLGKGWVDELMRDCPQFAALVAELVLQQAQQAGIALPVPSASIPPEPPVSLGGNDASQNGG